MLKTWWHSLGVCALPSPLGWWPVYRILPTSKGINLLAMASPIRPKPTMPTVAPTSPLEHIQKGLHAHLLQALLTIWLWASNNFLVVAKVRASVSSAVALDRTPDVGIFQCVNTWITVVLLILMIAWCVANFDAALFYFPNIKMVEPNRHCCYHFQLRTLSTILMFSSCP